MCMMEAFTSRVWCLVVLLSRMVAFKLVIFLFGTRRYDQVSKKVKGYKKINSENVQDPY